MVEAHGVPFAWEKGRPRRVACPAPAHAGILWRDLVL
ncbi:hypothetical protein CULC22_01670 [Corynebacterium ulcerans BR-AD22]|nr:hypothetical protein CULC22_01670 [Corynebacterium ulcerans BR-AD22]